MAPTKSRSQRKAAFLQAASEMYECLEAWYDAHPADTPRLKNWNRSCGSSGGR